MPFDPENDDPVDEEIEIFHRTEKEIETWVKFADMKGAARDIWETPLTLPV